MGQFLQTVGKAVSACARVEAGRQGYHDRHVSRGKAMR